METNIKAVVAKPYDGKPTWHGKYHLDSMWRTVANGSYRPIAYASPEAACAGARLQLSLLLALDHCPR